MIQNPWLKPLHASDCVFAHEDCRLNAELRYACTTSYHNFITGLRVGDVVRVHGMGRSGDVRRARIVRIFPDRHNRTINVDFLDRQGRRLHYMIYPYLDSRVYPDE